MAVQVQARGGLERIDADSRSAGRCRARHRLDALILLHRGAEIGTAVERDLRHLDGETPVGGHGGVRDLFPGARDPVRQNLSVGERSGRRPRECTNDRS